LERVAPESAVTEAEILRSYGKGKGNLKRKFEVVVTRNDFRGVTPNCNCFEDTGRLRR